MRKIIFIGILFLGLFSIIALVQTTRHKLLRDNLRPVQFAPTQQTREITSSGSNLEKKLSRPFSFTIEKLDLFKVRVEHVGLDNDGKMDVPENSENVAWFELGYLPGNKGSSVIAGHFDKKDGSPAVFYKLNSLNTGDEIIVEMEDGIEKIFLVTSKQLYPNDNFPAEKVFGKSDKKILNLITCDGTWDPAKKSYSDRLVVYAELAE